MQWASRQVYASLMRPAQLCTRMSNINIPDCDGHVHTYIHHERIDPHSEHRTNALGNYVACFMHEFSLRSDTLTTELLDLWWQRSVGWTCTSCIYQSHIQLRWLGNTLGHLYTYIHIVGFLTCVVFVEKLKSFHYFFPWVSL